ncbi:MAG: 3'(2'),5'-bisphosphate nucleotidase CysQ [Deltaproteobacteria bacterium]|nr:3'(2'),5'-bisphosphate nucleotidase CysQ [Deltaproteobacteria bacterium]
MLHVERDVALRAARHAAEAIAQVRAAGFGVEYKDAAQDDPVTAADRASNAAIVASLREAFPNDVIVAEEDDVPPGYPHAHRVWFVDPLDGTKEFVDGIGQWCVMIGLAIDGRAMMGVVVVPTLPLRDGDPAGYALVGEVGVGAWVVDASGAHHPLALGAPAEHIRVVTSRSRRSALLDAIFRELGGPREVRCGSVGVKVALVLLGEVDAYIHPGGGPKLWDLCAPEAIVRAAGGAFTDERGAPIDYASPVVAHTTGMVASARELQGRLLDAVARGLASAGAG